VAHRLKPRACVSSASNKLVYLVGLVSIVQGVMISLGESDILYGSECAVCIFVGNKKGHP
jgi:hypothetical protein